MELDAKSLLSRRSGAGMDGWGALRAVSSERHWKCVRCWKRCQKIYTNLPNSYKIVVHDASRLLYASFFWGGGYWCYCNLKTMLHPTTRVWIWFSEADMNGNHNQACHWMGTSAVTPNTTERRCCSSICKIYKRSGCTSMRVSLPSGHQAWHWKILHLLVQNEYHSISHWTLHLQWISNCHILPSCLIPGGHYA